MAGAKKKKNYLLLHRSGFVVKADTLTSPEPIEGILAIINLDTLEQYSEEGWEKIPSGYDSLLSIEENEYEDEYEDDIHEDDDDFIPMIQTGARRIFNPQLIWAYATHRRNKKSKGESL